MPKVKIKRVRLARSRRVARRKGKKRGKKGFYS
jgi:hypothetical protein